MHSCYTIINIVKKKVLNIFSLRSVDLFLFYNHQTAEPQRESTGHGMSNTSTGPPLNMAQKKTC